MQILSFSEILAIWLQRRSLWPTSQKWLIVHFFFHRFQKHPFFRISKSRFSESQNSPIKRHHIVDFVNFRKTQIQKNTVFSKSVDSEFGPFPTTPTYRKLEKSHYDSN
jgi:hypothetical protein